MQAAFECKLVAQRLCCTLHYINFPLSVDIKSNKVDKTQVKPYNEPEGKIQYLSRNNSNIRII